MIGQQKYDEELQLLKEIEEQEASSGVFLAMAGDIDTRDDQKKDI